jgi:hypothetical protein|tara:strand:+ start:126 stop:332 length:207 start_codon:yes stop_codon:yes gene_type:complete
LRSITGENKNKRGSFRGVIEKHLGEKVKVNSRQKVGSKVWVNEKPGFVFGGIKLFNINELGVGSMGHA